MSAAISLDAVGCFLALPRAFANDSPTFAPEVYRLSVGARVISPWPWLVSAITIDGSSQALGLRGLRWHGRLLQHRY